MQHDESLGYPDFGLNNKAKAKRRHYENELEFVVVCQKIKDEIARLESYRSDYNLFAYSTEAKINILNRLLQLLIVPESFPNKPVDYRTKYQLDNEDLDLNMLVNALLQDKQFKKNDTGQEVTNLEIFKAPASVLSNESDGLTFLYDLCQRTAHGKMKLNQIPREELLSEKSEKSRISKNYEKFNRLNKIQKPKKIIHQIVVFGDSLTDENLMRRSAVGNWSGLKGNSPKGSFTNGYTWLGHINMEMLDKAIIAAVANYLGPNFDGTDIEDFIEKNRKLIYKEINNTLTSDEHVENIFSIDGNVVSRSYAIGGATAHSYRGVPSKSIARYFARLVVSTLADERKMFLEDLPGILAEKKTPLVVQWIGANDLITVNEAPSMLEADNVVIAALENIKELIKNGCTDFRLGSLPDLSLTPRYQDKSKTDEERTNARLCSEYQNRQLEMGVKELQKMYPHCNIKVIDVNEKYKAIINALKEGGEAAKPYKKYINKEYSVKQVTDVELQNLEQNLADVKPNQFYAAFDDDYALSYAVLDPCGQPQCNANTKMSFNDLCQQAFKNIIVDQEVRLQKMQSLREEIDAFRNSGKMSKDGDLWKCIIALTTEKGDTLDEKDIYTPIKSTKAFDRLVAKLAAETPPKTIEDIGYLPGVNVPFFDDVHPSADMHRFIYDEIMKSIGEDYIIETPAIKLNLEKHEEFINPITNKKYISKDDSDIPEKKEKISPIPNRIEAHKQKLKQLNPKNEVDRRKLWSEDELIVSFLRHYNEQFNDERRGVFGFFRQRKLEWDKDLSLEKILKHALHPEHGTGARSLDILVNKLGWITADGKVNPKWASSNNAPDLTDALRNIQPKNTNKNEELVESMNQHLVMSK